MPYDSPAPPELVELMDRLRENSRIAGYYYNEATNSMNAVREHNEAAQRLTISAGESKEKFHKYIAAGVADRQELLDLLLELTEDGEKIPEPDPNQAELIGRLE